MKCPACGFECPEGVKFCPECGTKIVVKKVDLYVCPNCKGDVTKEDKRCPNCGKPVKCVDINPETDALPKSFFASAPQPKVEEVKKEEPKVEAKEEKAVPQREPSASMPKVVRIICASLILLVLMLMTIGSFGTIAYVSVNDVYTSTTSYASSSLVYNPIYPYFPSKTTTLGVGYFFGGASSILSDMSSYTYSGTGMYSMVLFTYIFLYVCFLAHIVVLTVATINLIIGCVKAFSRGQVIKTKFAAMAAASSLAYVAVIKAMFSYGAGSIYNTYSVTVKLGWGPILLAVASAMLLLIMFAYNTFMGKRFNVKGILSKGFGFLAAFMFLIALCATFNPLVSISSSLYGTYENHGLTYMLFTNNYSSYYYIRTSVVTPLWIGFTFGVLTIASLIIGFALSMSEKYVGTYVLGGCAIIFSIASIVSTTSAYFAAASYSYDYSSYISPSGGYVGLIVLVVLAIGLTIPSAILAKKAAVAKAE